MGREVRRVPADWVHPSKEKNIHGFPHQDSKVVYQPMYDDSYANAAKTWNAEVLAWESLSQSNAHDGEFWEWNGDPPDEEYYRPDWPEETRTHYQMYETCSEGTPISPVMETPEELARWLTDNNASAFGRETASYEAWLRVAKGGYAGMETIYADGRIVSGVESMP